MKLDHKEVDQSPSPTITNTNTDATGSLLPNLDGTLEILEETTTLKPPVPKAAPSAFAQALLNNDSASEAPSRLYPPPWMAYTNPDAIREAFSKPSPDDVVLAAQSQGSMRTTKK